jgi:hypothetical protein
VIALRTCRAGTAALEFALVAPLFVTIVAGTVEVARWGWGAAALRDAAAGGARCLRVTPERCGSLKALQEQLDDSAPVDRLDVAKSACGLRVTARGGYPATLAPGMAATAAHACAP